MNVRNNNICVHPTPRHRLRDKCWLVLVDEYLKDVYRNTGQNYIVVLFLFFFTIFIFQGNWQKQVRARLRLSNIELEQIRYDNNLYFGWSAALSLSTTVSFVGRRTGMRVRRLRWSPRTLSK